MSLEEKIIFLSGLSLYRDALTKCIRALEGRDKALMMKAYVLWDCSERHTDEWKDAARNLIQETLASIAAQ